MDGQKDSKWTVEKSLSRCPSTLPANTVSQLSSLPLTLTQCDLWGKVTLIQGAKNEINPTNSYCIEYEVTM